MSRSILAKDLVLSPLQASCCAQSSLYQATIDFVQSTGLNEETGKVNFVYFQFPCLKNVADLNSEVVSQEKTVQLRAPLVSLMTPPFLSIKQIKFKFDMELHEPVLSDSAKNEHKELEAQLKWGHNNTNSGSGLKGALSLNRNAAGIAKSIYKDQSIKYTFEINAKKQECSDGLSKLYDFLNKHIVAID